MSATQMSFPANSGIPRDRVTAERADLDARIERLSEVIGSPDFKRHNALEQALIFDQLACMQKYSLILAKRLLLY